MKICESELRVLLPVFCRIGFVPVDTLQGDERELILMQMPARFAC